jgi:hypothetical protein
MKQGPSRVRACLRALNPGQGTANSALMMIQVAQRTDTACVGALGSGSKLPSHHRHRQAGREAASGVSVQGRGWLRKTLSPGQGRGRGGTWGGIRACSVCHERKPNQPLLAARWQYACSARGRGAIGPHLPLAVRAQYTCSAPSSTPAARLEKVSPSRTSRWQYTCSTPAARLAKASPPGTSRWQYAGDMPVHWCIGLLRARLAPETQGRTTTAACSTLPITPQLQPAVR